MSKSAKETSVKASIDINGLPLALMEDLDLNQYISVSDAKRFGFQLFNTSDAAKIHVLHELKEFLEVQAAIFFRFKNLTYDSKSLDINIQFNDLCKSKQLTSNVQSPILNGNGNIVDQRKPLHNQSQRKVFNPVGSPQSTSSRNENKENMGSGPISRSSSRNSVTSVGSNRSVTNRQRLQKMTAKVKSSSPVAQQGNLNKNLPKVEKCLKFLESRIICLEKMKPDIVLPMQVLRITSPTTFVAFIMSDDYMEFDDVLNAINITEELPTPSCGDFVIVKLSDDRVSRAYILELLKDKYKVAAIEYAEVVEVAKVFAVPKNLLQYHEFICSCEASLEYVQSLSVDCGIETKTRPNNVVVDVPSNSYIKCKSWIPELVISSALSRMPAVEKTPPKVQQTVKVEQKIFTVLPTNMVPVPIGEKLFLAGFAEGVLHLRSKKMHSLITSMNKLLQGSRVETLEKPPAIQQYVLLQMDGEKKEWRRCLVRGVLPQGVLVVYIDYFQSQEVVPASRLFNLTSDAIFGPTLLKARLRYFEEKEYSINAQQHMEECAKKKFDVVFLDEDVIDLKSDDSPKCLSQVLLELDMPKIKTIKDLPPVYVKINEELAILVLQIDDGRFYFCPTDMAAEQLSSICDTLNAIKLEQVEASVVKDQLVVAQYEGDWYRGVVKEVKSVVASVFFIDFGNVADVVFDEIREVPEDVLNNCAWALQGTLTNAYDLVEANYSAIITKIDKGLHHVKILKMIEE